MLDAIRSRYAAICALPSRQQLLDSKALLVRANGTDPTQLLLLIHATTPPLLFCELGVPLLETVCQDLGAKLGGLRLPLRLWLGLLRSARQGFPFGVQGLLELLLPSSHAHPPMPMPLTLPLSVRTAFLAFIRRRDFTLRKPLPRSLNLLADFVVIDLTLLSYVRSSCTLSVT